MASEFQEAVWAACRKIPKGRVSTYTAIARAIGRSGAVRAVGNALNQSPGMPTTPCHRVVRSDGSVGGYAHGTKKKIARLREEGVEIRDGRVANLKNIV